MIIRVLIAVVLAVPAYFYTMRYNMHMFQQNGYKNKEHLHWLKKKFRLQWILYFGLALGIVTCVFPYLALEIFEYLVLFVIIVVYRAMKRMNTKKKLVYTAPVGGCDRRSDATKKKNGQQRMGIPIAHRRHHVPGQRVAYAAKSAETGGAAPHPLS